MRERRATPAAGVLDAAVLREARAVPERHHEPTGLEEDDVVVRCRPRGPAERLVERACSGQIAHSERDEADALLHGGSLPGRSRGRSAAMRSPKAPGLLLGLGLGGFIDGIVLHQILQWHHMLTGEGGGEPMDTVAGLEANTLVDGFFHLATWLLVVLGITLAVRAWQHGWFAPPWRTHVGLLLAGWGVFNLVEGTVDHLLLGIHHARDDLGGPLGWDLGFLAFGVALLIGGAAPA